MKLQVTVKLANALHSKSTPPVEDLRIDSSHALDQRPLEGNKSLNHNSPFSTHSDKCP